MIKKEFQYKGQQINYYNKLKNNNNIDFAFSYYDAQTGCYVIKYSYITNKKNV